MNELLKRYPCLEECKDSINNALELMIDTYRSGGKVLVCGNGGSAADCEHIVGELMKGFMKKREVTDNRIPEEMRKNLQGSLSAISLPSQSAVLSAFINDVEPMMMYAQLVYGYAKQNDLVIGISTSGNSKNVVNAVEVARCMGVKTLSLTGQSPPFLLLDTSMGTARSSFSRLELGHARLPSSTYRPTRPSEPMP